MSDPLLITVEHPSLVQDVLPPSVPRNELFHYGDSAAAIIIAIAILLRTVGDMIGVLVPVMLQRNERSQGAASSVDLAKTD